MSIRFRSMRPKDVSPCVEIIARHPLLGPHYGITIQGLETAWRSLLGSEALLALVCEEHLPGQPPRILGSYAAVFVTDAFARQISTPPFRWIGPPLVERVNQGNSPVLTDAQVRNNNSAGGLNLVIWPSGPMPEAENRMDIRQVSQAAFFEAYRGYLLKQLNAQAAHPMEIIMALNSGGWCLRSDDGQLIRTLDEPAETFIRKPHMLQITRDLALQQVGTWTWHFFQYRRPVLGLARSEQRLLVLAAQGGTDVELAVELRISLSAVKKTWSSIYRRITDHDFDLFPKEEPNRGGDAQTDRGREKKHKLIAYTREHPEELRPYVPRLVDEAPDPTPADYRPRPPQANSSLQQTPSIHPEPSKRSRAS